MPTPFLSSTPGRVLLAAATVFLATTAVYLIAHNLYVLGIGMPLGITLAFVGVGLGMSDYLKETLFSVMVLPVALWGLMYLVGELDHRQQIWAGYVLGLLAVLAAGRALMGGGSEATA